MLLPLFYKELWVIQEVDQRIHNPGPGFTKGLKQKNVITLGEKS